MIRNGTGFWLHYNAYNAANNASELNDSANHTLKLVIDGIETDPTNSPEDIAAGECRIFVTAAESDGAKFIAVAGVSSTADVYIIEGFVITDLLIPGVAFVGCFTVWDSANNQPALGEDSLSLTMTIAQDNTSGGATNNPTELGALTVPGLYTISVTAAEANGTAVSILGSSSTTGANVISTELMPYNEDQADEADVESGVSYAEGTLTGTLVITTVTQPLEIIEIETLEVIEL